MTMVSCDRVTLHCANSDELGLTQSMHGISHQIRQCTVEGGIVPIWVSRRSMTMMSCASVKLMDCSSASTGSSRSRLVDATCAGM